MNPLLKFAGIFLLVITVLPYGTANAQKNEEIIADITAYRDSLNTAFKNPETSPLKPNDFDSFTELDFFPIDLNYHIKARFVRSTDPKPFKIPTTTSEFKTYEKYGELHFSLHGKKQVLDVYQSLELRETEQYRDYLFLPFKDMTNGNETYGGGRYLEMWIPKNDTFIVDFNQAYNPYCVYNTKYSCPLVPKSNWMDVPVYAGVKDFKK